MKQTQLPFDRDLKNMMIITAFVLLQCVGVIILLALIFSFIPQPLNDFVKTIFRNHQGGVLPEREMLFYRLFVFMAMIGQGAVVWTSRRFFKGELPLARLGEFLIVEAVLIYLQVFAVFKIFVFENPWWARMLLYGGILLTVLCAVFWPEIRRLSVDGFNRWGELSGQALRRIQLMGDVGLIAVIALCLLVPDIDKVLARAFIWGQFNQLDLFLVAPAWTVFNGGQPSGYALSAGGFILPWLSAALSHMAGFSYAVLAQLVMGAAIIYMIGVYGLLRLLTGRVIISIIGILLAIKLKLFHQGTYPLILIHPEISPLAHWPDLIFLGAVIRHAQDPRRLYLWVMAVVSGFMLVYAPAWGAAMLAAFYYYSFGVWTTRITGANDVSWGLRKRGLLLLAPILTALALLLIVAPNVLLDPGSRAQWLDQLRFIAHGYNALPMYFGLQARQFFAYFLGYAVVLVYLFVIAAGMSRRVIDGGSQKLLAMGAVSVYGVGLFFQYVHHSSSAHYHTFAVPFVLVLVFLAQTILDPLSRAMRACVLSAGMGWAVMALSTTFLFTYYPNVLSLSGYDWKTEKELYNQQSNLDADAQLIRALTPVKDKAAVISSFETKLLLLSGRKNFFDPFPLMVSAPMANPEFRGLRIVTRAQLNQMVERLRRQSPEYVFIEKKLFERKIHPQFYQYFEGLEAMVSFLGEHYQKDQEGVYLVALKKKQGKK